MMDMVERVARALYTEFIPAIERREGSTKKQWDDLDPDEDAIYLKCWMQMANAAIEAMREPTEEMMAGMLVDRGMARQLWQAMISAALNNDKAKT